MGPLKRLAGVKRIPSVLDDSSDLNHAIRRFLAAVDACAGDNLGDLSAPALDQAKVKCRYRALDRIKAADNPAAYLTAAAGNATCLGDLVGDDFVTELRQKPKRKKTADPKRLSEVIA